jgi:uncharacterized protein (TIGR04255 family)
VQITRRHYDHAPITEAVIAIGCELPTEIRLEDLLKVHEPLKSDYPKRAEQFTVQFHIDAAEAQGKVGPPEVVGYQFASEDGKRLVRVTLNEFAFSQLAPYDRWETLRAEARRVWDVYDSLLHPRRITRVAVRYINRIDIPDTGTGVDLDIYFRTAPKIAPELPQSMKTYFVRLEIPFREPGGLLIITETVVPPVSPSVLSAVLDLDAIVQNVALDVEGAWRTIEELRDEKNAAFEACITDATRDLIK